jgi:MFS family permease
MQPSKPVKRATPHPLRQFLHAYGEHLAALQRNARLFLISNIVLNTTAGALGVLYAIFLKQLGYDTDFQSNLLVVGIVGAGAGLIPSLTIANRYSARRLLIWSNLIGGAAAGVQLIWIQPAILYITSFIVGMSVAIYTILTPPLLAANSTSVERAHLFTLNSASGWMTAMLGALLGGWLPTLTATPWILHSWPVRMAGPLLTHGSALPLQLGLLIVGIFSILSLLPLFMMDDAVLGDQPVSQVARSQEIGRASGKQGRFFGHESLTSLRSKIANLSSDLLAPLFSKKGGQYVLLRYVAYQGCLGIGAGLFLTYINLYFVDELHMSTAAYGVISASSTTLLAIGALSGPILGERLGAVRGPIISQLCGVPLLFVLAFSRNIPLIVVVYLIRGVLMNIGSPILQSFIMGCVTPRERNIASSAMTMSWQAMLAVGGYMSGYILKYLGYTPAFLGAAACYLCGMLLLVPWFGHELQIVPTPLPTSDAFFPDQTMRARE